DLQSEPIGHNETGLPIYLKDIWPTQQEVADVVGECITGEMFRANYADVFKGDEKWNAIEIGDGDRYEWVPTSTYVKKPPYFEGMERVITGDVDDLNGLAVLAILGDSVTTDHISPAGSIKLNSPAGEYLTANGVTPVLFNSYGSRRGNHETMVRGTFANVRLKNQIAPGTEGGYAKYWPTGEILTIFDASERYQKSKKGLIILAGKEYGSGSSRDWAAKGPYLLGVKAVIAESYERIHRSNLIGMGILPLQFEAGQNASTLGLDGSEEYAVMDLAYHASRNFKDGKDLKVHAVQENGDMKVFGVKVRIDTPKELEYYRHGGILQYVLRQLLD
ncbi:MAG: aconitate hydratase, partial [Fimbriimonadaceae bacterium]